MTMVVAGPLARFTLISTERPRAFSQRVNWSMEMLVMRPDRTLESVGWSVPQSAAACFA